MNWQAQRIADDTLTIDERSLTGNTGVLADGRAFSHGLQESILFFAAGELACQQTVEFLAL